VWSEDPAGQTPGTVAEVSWPKGRWTSALWATISIMISDEHRIALGLWCANVWVKLDGEVGVERKPNSEANWFQGPCGLKVIDLRQHDRCRSRRGMPGEGASKV